MDYLAGIDLGSTSLKAVIYDTGGNAVASASRETEKHGVAEHDDWAIWKPEQIWGGAADAMREAVSAIGDARDIKGVAVTGMGMDGLPVDADGHWLYPFISWQDPRTAPQLQWWKQHVGIEKTFATGGNTLWQFSTALRILWMAENEPEILGRTDKWLLIEDFVNFMLCGVRATDYTMASCTLLFDQAKLDWSDELLAAAGIDRSLMCDARPSGTVIGEVTSAAAEKTGLAAGTPVVLGGHDYLCGALPVGAFRPGSVLDITGTWEIVLTSTPAPVLTPAVRDAGMTVEAHAARGMYAAWGGAVAAAMVEWYRKTFGFEAAQRAERDGGSDWDYLVAEAAASPPGARGVMFLPHMASAGCPVVDPQSRGAFIGLGSSPRGGDLLRAVYEGLNYQFLHIVQTLEQSLDIEVDRLVGVGGAIKNAFWMQNKADVMGRPIEVPEVEEATPLGAAMLAGIGVGSYRDMDEAYERVRKPGRIYEPDTGLHAGYRERFAVYTRMYPALADLHHRIHELGTA